MHKYTRKNVRWLVNTKNNGLALPVFIEQALLHYALPSKQPSQNWLDSAKQYKPQDYPHIPKKLLPVTGLIRVNTLFAVSPCNLCPRLKQ